MEKTHKFKTLKGLVSKTQQYSFNAFLSGRMCHNKNGWVKVKLSPELRTEVENKFKSVVGDLNLNISCSYGLFDRLVINKRLKCQYIAGQEYTGELRYLKKLIKGGC